MCVCDTTLPLASGFQKHPLPRPTPRGNTTPPPPHAGQADAPRGWSDARYSCPSHGATAAGDAAAAPQPAGSRGYFAFCPEENPSRVGAVSVGDRGSSRGHKHAPQHASMLEKKKNPNFPL